ncbi:CCT motif family protein [Trifolium repens]|nr:CCT motif family protein [Trifolium repens]
MQQQYNQLGEYGSVTQPNLEVSYSNGGGSGCSSYMGSPSNYEERLMQRSISSQSLQKNDGHHHHHQHLFPNLFSELLDTENGPVRRVYSTGDLDQVRNFLEVLTRWLFLVMRLSQSTWPDLFKTSSCVECEDDVLSMQARARRVNGLQQHYHHQSDSPLSTESNMIIEEMSRAASPYSPEEKKYVCRKTLADSRPRIRGRFAKNDEIVMNPPNQYWSHISNNGDEILEDEEDENWDNLFDSLVPTSNLAHEEEEEPQHSSSFGMLY